jgi:membrane protein YdbS with pleckstrin-like domain
VSIVRSRRRRGPREPRGVWQEFIYNLILPDYDEAVRPDTIINYAERRHLVYLIRHTWGAFLVLMGAVVVLSASGGWPAILSVLAAIASLLYILWTSVHWAVVVLYVTDRRLLEVGGFFSMTIAVLPLTKLTDLKFEQGFLGRLFTYGSIRVETAGQVQALSLIADVRLPLLFYQEISRPPRGPTDPGED